MSIFAIIGWIGTILYITAYFLLVKGHLSADKSTYHYLNLGGGICLVINAINLGDYPGLAVNGIWAALAIWMILKLLFKKEDYQTEE
ncbi:MAG: hypothetical protein AAFY71_27310 [Bacteroidota bacterium]